MAQNNVRSGEKQRGGQGQSQQGQDSHKSGQQGEGASRSQRQDDSGANKGGKNRQMGS